MSIRTRIAQTFENVTKVLWGVGDPADANFSIFNTSGNYADTKRLGKYKGIVFAAVNLISDEMAKYQPIFNKEIDGHLEPIKSHYLLRLFKKPNKDTSQGDFFKAVSIYKNIVGESFWYHPLGETTRLPTKELYLLPPDKMSIKIDDEGEVIGYALRKNNGQEVLFKPEEVTHAKTFNPSNPYRGYGIVEAALDYIETEEGARQFSKNFFKNSGTPSGILSIKADIGRDSFRKFAQRWREQHEGTKNAGKVAIIRSGEVAFTKMSLGLNEIDMKILKELTIGEVLMMFRVPKSLLGMEMEQGLGRASVESLEYIFAKRTIDPEMRLLDKAVQRILDTHFPKDQLTVTHENIIPADKEFELEERKAAVDNWVTRDEIRQEEGLEDLPGGEFLRAPFNTIALDGSETASAPSETPKMLVKVTKTVKKKTFPVEVKERFRLTLQRKQRAYERRFSITLDPVLAKQKAEVVKTWNLLRGKGINGVVKAVEDHLLDIPEATKAFENALFPVQLSLAQEQGKLALVFAGLEDAAFEVTPVVQKFIRDAVSKMAYQFNEQTLKDLGQIVIEGLKEGKGTKAIARDLGDAYGDIRGYRAERLSRTETLRASNEATRMAYKQTGYVEKMEWYANPGACVNCAELAGTTVRLDENFANLGDTVGSIDINYLAVQTPPLHPNCECTVTPVRD